MENLVRQLAESFIETKAFKYDPINRFPLSSGELSPYYFDCKSLLAYPQPREIVAKLAYEKIKDLNFSCIGGEEIGAIPLATAISAYAYASESKIQLRTFVVRKQPKGHGLRNLIEGAAHSDDRALVVDDVLTTGGSICRAVKAAREAGLCVEYALVVVDREEHDGRKNVEKEGIKLISIMTIHDILEASRVLAHS